MFVLDILIYFHPVYPLVNDVTSTLPVFPTSTHTGFPLPLSISYCLIHYLGIDPPPSLANQAHLHPHRRQSLPRPRIRSPAPPPSPSDIIIAAVRTSSTDLAYLQHLFASPPPPRSTPSNAVPNRPPVCQCATKAEEHTLLHHPNVSHSEISLAPAFYLSTNRASQDSCQGKNSEFSSQARIGQVVPKVPAPRSLPLLHCDFPMLSRER